MNEDQDRVLVLSPASAPSALDFFAVDLPFESQCLRIKDNITTYAIPSISRVTQLMSQFDKKFHVVAFGRACRYVVEAMELRLLTGESNLGSVILVEPHLKSNTRIPKDGADIVWVVKNPANVFMSLANPWFSMATRGPTFINEKIKTIDINKICDHIGYGNSYNCLQKRNVAKFKGFIVKTLKQHKELCKTS